VINFLYGSNYAPAASVLRIVAWAGIFSNIGSARGIFVQAEGKQRAIKYISAITAGFTIALNAWLIPIYGLNGAAIACLAGFISEAIIATLIVPDTRQYLVLYASSFKTLHDYIKNWLQRRKEMER
jgi:O-antigen/teichoic acid export membrane protein